MNHPDHDLWTDQEVARLPLHQGRAELLEEIIISTPAADPGSRPTTIQRRRRWLVPVAAAAAVAALATGPLWWPEGSPTQIGPGASPGTPTVETPAAPATTPPPTPAVTGHYGQLDDAAWIVDSGSDNAYGGEVDYRRGERQLTINWYPAASYDDYVEDRRHITEPPSDGAPVEVAGAAGQLWAYSADDHAVIREVQGGFWTEVRGSGMGEAAFRSLLDQVRLVDLDTFEEGLPDMFVTGAERDAAIAEIRDGIETVSGAGLHPDVAPPTSTESDPYQLGAEIAGVYACDWIGEFADGGDRTEAARVLATSRQWPVLQEMDADGDFPEVVWEYADEVAAGRVPAGYRGGLGCR